MDRHIRGSDMAAGIRAVPQPKSGTIEVTLIENGKDLCSNSIVSSDASEFALVLLRAAQVGFEASGKPWPDPTTVNPTVASPNSAYMAHIPALNGPALVLHFGDAVVGISIPREFRRQVGEQLLALSAQEGPAH